MLKAACFLLSVLFLGPNLPDGVLAVEPYVEWFFGNISNKIETVDQKVDSIANQLATKIQESLGMFFKLIFI